jgi:tyrosinase-like protein/polyphenol oxidase-like protein
MHIRREVRSLDPADPTLKHYADAVAEMETRSEREDPTSWLYQAAVHGTQVNPALAEWNQCTHNTWFFVSWHRIFLFYFEQIVRSVIGELHGAEAAEKWALPYWNYCRGGEYATLPEAFREETTEDGSPNPLFVAERDPVINAGGELEAASVESAKALARPGFIGRAEFGGKRERVTQFGEETSRGVVENTPHGTVHDGVGGWMANILTAAKDPIFWLHHCNIDRIWVQWIAQGSGEENPPEAGWLDQVFEFYDAEKKLDSKTCGDVVDTEALDYKYDSVDGVPTGAEPAPQPEAEVAMAAPANPPSEEQPASAEPPTGPKIVGASEEKVTLTGEPAGIPVEIDERAREEVREASTESDPRRLYLNIENIEGNSNPGVSYGIYVNLPKGADAKAKEEHHVGNVSLFGIERAPEPLKDEPAHNVATSVEIGPLLRILGGGEHFEQGEIYVTFLPLLPNPPKGQEDEYRQLLEERKQGPPVHIGRVSIGIDA